MQSSPPKGKPFCKSLFVLHDKAISKSIYTRLHPSPAAANCLQSSPPQGEAFLTLCNHSKQEFEKSVELHCHGKRKALRKGFPLGGSWRRRRLMRGDQFALAQCLQSLVLSLPPIKCVAAPCKKSIPPRATKTSPESTRTKQSETKFHHAKAGALGGSSGRMREVWREKGHPPKGGPFSLQGLPLSLQGLSLILRKKP